MEAAILWASLSSVSSIPGLQRADAIAKFLNINTSTVAEAVEFFCATELCARNKDGSIGPGTRLTYLPPDSPFTYSHRLNWRLKAIEKLSKLEPHDLVFSSHLSLSEKDMEEFRDRLSQLIRELYAKVENSPSERAVIFNIDWMTL